MAADTIRWMQTVFAPASTGLHEACWRPPADVYRTREGWLVKFDLAGVRPEDVTLELRGRALTVRGSRRDCCVEEGCRSYRLEISYSKFERTLELPVDLVGARVATEFRDGMLLVRITDAEVRKA